MRTKYKKEKERIAKGTQSEFWIETPTQRCKGIASKRCKRMAEIFLQEI
jgi:hypothetical protein